MTIQSPLPSKYTWRGFLAKLGYWLGAKSPREIATKLLCGLVMLGFGWYCFQIIFVETYVWQTTTLAKYIDPVSRTSCVLGALQSNPANIIATKQKPKIGLLMIYNNQDGNWNEALMERVIKNREKYCSMYGYQLVNANDIVDKSRPAAWSKLLAMEHYLKDFDYLLYIDMDVVIMNFGIGLESFIALAPEKDFIMAEDWNGLNTGIWLAKNTEFSHNFLKLAWNQSHLVKKTSPEGINYPFEYEQRSFHFLLHSEIWQQRHLEKYRGDVEELRAHFKQLPQCSMNSYILYPWYWKGDREVSHYVQGDFLVHFAGKKGRVKTNLMEYFLDQVV